MAQFNADIALRLKTEALDKQLKQIENKIGGLASQKQNTRGLVQQYNLVNQKLEKATKEVVKRGLAEKTNTRELKNQSRELAKQQAQRQKQRRQRTESLALGAGFPLLFGGGAGAVAGGLLGAGLQQNGGFGLQVLFSAIGTAVDAFAQDVAKTGQALNSTGGAFDLLTEKSLFSSKETQLLAENLAELGQVEELAALATEELVGIIGNKGVESLQTLGDTTDETTRLWAQLTLQLQALISGPLNGFLSLVNQFLGSIVNPARFRSLVEENQAAQEYFDSIVEKRNKRGRIIQEGVSKADARAATLEKFPPVVTAQIPVTAQDRKRFAPPKTSTAAADKAARDEERLQKRLAQLRAETALIKDQTALIEEQTAAKIEGNRLTQIDVEALVKSVELDARRLRTLIGVTDERERAAINAKFEAEQTKLVTQAVADQEIVRAALNEQIDQSVIGFQNEVALIGQTTQKAKDLLKIEQDIAKLRKDNPFITDEQISKYRQAAQAATDAREEQRKYNELLKKAQGYATPLVNSLVSGLREVAAGTKTAAEAFADFLNTIADQLAQTAAQMIAQYIALGIARMFAMGQQPSGGLPFGGGSDLGIASGGGFGAGFFGLAKGGTATGGQPYIVGEEGPELFIPGVTGTVTNNDQFEAARDAMGGGGGSSEAFSENAGALAVASSYTRERVMERENNERSTSSGTMLVETQVINNVEYVSKEQLEVATAASAQKARAQVFSDMRNRPATRRQLGLNS